MALKIFNRKPEDAEVSMVPRPRRSYRPRPPVRQEKFEPAMELDLAEDQLHRQLQLERYAFIAINRDLWLKHPEVEKVYREAVLAIDENFAMVPEGFVSLPQSIVDSPGACEQDFETEPFLMARCCITNA